jgi:2-haloacid dehalogenase
MKKRYELILFDLDGTLFDYNRAEEYALKNSLENFGIDCNFSSCLAQYRKINRAMWKEFEKGKINLKNLRLKRFDVLFGNSNIKKNIEEFSKKYLYFISKTSFINEGAEEIISYLRSDYKLALATNGIYSAQYERLKRSSLSAYFDIFVVSEEIGFAKPDPDFFNCVFKKARHSDKSTALIVGDSLSSDIKGGINFGIDTCWFNPGKIKSEGRVLPTYEIERLNQIKDILTTSHQK